MYRRLILLISILSAVTLTSMAFDKTVYASGSRLATGHWVKIKTTAEGIYQLSYDELKSLGFSNPSKVQVYGYGATELPSLENSYRADFPDDVQPVATRHTADGRILFYGQGDARMRSNYSISFSRQSNEYFSHVRNPYDTASYYFLSDAAGVTAAPSVGHLDANADAEPLSSHIHVDFIEHETQNKFRGSSIFHGPSHTAGETISYTFNITDYKPTPSHPMGSFYYKYALKSPSSVSLSTELPAKLFRDKNHPFDNEPYYPPPYDTDYIYQTFDRASGYISFSNPNLVEGDFTFKVNVPGNANLIYCAEDYVMLRYPRANRLNEKSPFLVMNFPYNEKEAGRQVLFEGVPSGDLEVWNIDGALPRTFKATYNTDGTAAVVLDGNTSTAISFRPSMTFDSPEIIGEIDNQDIHGAPTPDMLIITVADQEAHALEIAELHRRYQGLDVMVLVHDKVYNEFSSGSRDAMAYRRVAKMFYDRDPDKFRFLMFMGPAYFDNRCITGLYADRLVCYEQDIESLAQSEITNFAADSYFAMLKDDYNHQKIHLTMTQINVGRVSSINPSQASVYVKKVRDRFENPVPPEITNHVLLMCGAGDNNIHSSQAIEVFENMRRENPALTFTPAEAEAYPNGTNHTQLHANALIDGVGYMVYIGHGSQTAISGWDVSYASGTQYQYLPFVMFSSCDQFSFDHISNGLMETMIFTDGGGAIAGIAADRSVWIDYNQLSCIPVSTAFAEAKSGTTYGELFRRSREIVLGMASKFADPIPPFCNVLSYNLAGDPALPVGAPAFSASVTSVDGADIAVDGGTLKPFESASISGQISLDGKLASDFNGTVRVELFDGSHIVPTFNYYNVANYRPNYIVFDSQSLALGYGDVTAGRFSVDITVPVPAYPTGLYRMVITAESADGSAIGLYDGIKIADFDADAYAEKEFTAPEIKEMYAADPAFESGDMVSARTTLYALIEPSESGLRSESGAIATRSTVTVDGAVVASNIEGLMRRVPGGALSLELPVKELADGIHTIELTVVNNAGLTASRAIEVLVGKSNVFPVLDVAQTPAREYVDFDLEGVSGVSVSRLVVTDAGGNTVFSTPADTTVSFPFRWNLCDTDGRDVADGLYKASVMVRTDAGYGSSPATDVVVLR